MLVDEDWLGPDCVASGAAVVSGDPPPPMVTTVLLPAESPKNPDETSEELGDVGLVAEAF